MAVVDDLRTELEESVDLTGLVISDLNILNNIVFPVKTAVDLYVLYQAQSNLLFDNLSQTEKGLLVLSKLPYIGGPLGAIRFVGKRFNETLQDVSDTLSVIDKPLDIVDKALTGVSVPLALAQLTANSALAVNSTRLDVLDSLENQGAISGTSTLTGNTEANFEQLQQANDITRVVTDETEPLRNALGVLDFPVFGLLADALALGNKRLAQINQVFEPFGNALDKLEDAIDPVEWALDGPSSVIDDVVKPVIDGIMNSTGLSDLIENLGDLLFGDISFLEGLGTIADRVTVELSNNDVAGLVNGFWDEFSVLFDPGGGIDLTNTIGVLEIDDNGALNVIGTNGDDNLSGTGNDDNFAPLEGDDTINGLAGIDRMFFLKNIEDYRVEFVTGADGVERIQVSPRSDETAREGIDLLENIELLRFANPLIGDITRDDILQFLYTAPGQPNLAGDDNENWLFGDSANNILDAAGGDDTLFGGDGNDNVSGGAGADLIYAGDGNDKIDGGLGIDRIYAGAGDDWIIVTDGADSVFGGDGFDVVDFRDRDAGVTVDFTTGAVDYGPDGTGALNSVEGVKATAFDDLFLGSSSADIVWTFGGNDRFLYAGAGDQMINLGSGGVSVDGVPEISFLGGGYQGVRIEVVPGDPARGLNGNWLTQASQNALNGFSVGALDFEQLVNVNVFEGTNQSDAFYALGVTGRRIAEFSYEYTFSDEAPVDVDEPATETLTLNGSVFRGAGGADVFFGSERSNLFIGGEGFDLVNYSLDYTRAREVGIPGIQGLVIDLSTGWARQNGGGGAAFLDDRLIGIEGVVGTRTDDIIIGNDEANYLFGYLGNDTIRGGGGDDYIDAGYSVGSELWGEDGNDIFALGPAANGQVFGGDGIDTIELKPDQAFRLDAFFDPDALGDEGTDKVNVSGWTVDLAGTGSIGSATSEFNSPDATSHEYPDSYTTQLTSIENVLGSDFDDLITGSDSANTLIGRGGNDLLLGAGGNDVLGGGAGSDTLEGGSGDDLLSGGDESGVVTQVAESGFYFGDITNDPWLVVSGPFDGWANTINGEIELWKQGTNGMTGQGSMLELDVDPSEAANDYPPDNISKLFDTEEGKQYRLEFTMSNRWGRDYLSESQGLWVTLNGAEFDASLVSMLTDNGPVQMSGAEYLSASQADTWTTYTVDFVGSGSDRIGFSEVWYLTQADGTRIHLPSDGFGPVIGNIKLLEVGGEVDYLTGGTGNDTFVLQPYGGADEILDFTIGEDRISLVAFNTEFGGVELRESPDGNGTDIFVDGEIVGRVVGVAPSSLGENDFVFSGPTAPASDPNISDSDSAGSTGPEGNDYDEDISGSANVNQVVDLAEDPAGGGLNRGTDTERGQDREKGANTLDDSAGIDQYAGSDGGDVQSEPQGQGDWMGQGEDYFAFRDYPDGFVDEEPLVFETSEMIARPLLHEIVNHSELTESSDLQPDWRVVDDLVGV